MKDTRLNSSQVDWNDLKLCLVVARFGTVSGAAHALGLSHSTLLRRIANLEERLGVVLFRRKTNGYELNGAGQRLIEAIEDIDTQVTDVLAAVQGTDTEMRGRIVCAVPDLSGSALMSVIQSFQDTHPDVSIEFEVSQSANSITTGDAHVAVALTATAPPGQIGAPIGPAAFSVYGDRSLIENVGVEDLAWVGLSPSLQHIPVGRFDRLLSRRLNRVHLCGSVSLHYSAIRAGLGVGLLACAVGDSHDDLVRVSGTFCDPQLTLWVLHRRELRSNVRVTAFFRHLRTALLRQKVLIVGDRPAHEERRIAAFDDHDEIESAMADKVG